MRSNTLTPDTNPTWNTVVHSLCRTLAAGRSQSLTDEFTRLERSPRVTSVRRHNARGLASARLALTPSEGRGNWEVMRIGNDLLVILSDFIYANPRFEFTRCAGLVHFDFKLSGDVTYRISRTTPAHTHHPSLRVWQEIQGLETRLQRAKSSRQRSVSINVRPEFLVEQLLPSSGTLPPKLHALVFPPVSGFDDCQLPLTEQMIEIATKLIDNPYENLLHLTYTEALALELLCFAVANFWTLPDQSNELYNEHELSALSYARRILMEQLAPAPTLRQIARTVGLGKRALSQGFKTVYGESLFAFGFRCRMQYAMTLLRDRDWPMDRVSAVTGYQHTNAFATAFRDYFGVGPTELKVPTPVERQTDHENR